MIEILEPRISPASLTMAGRLLTYTDLDGDLVKVTFSNAIMAESDLDFGTGGFLSGDIATPQQLNGVILAGKTGAGFTLRANPKSAGVGDGHANVGAIQAADTDLGNIDVDGNVASIQAGDENLDNGLGLVSFVALSLGKAGSTSTTEVKGLGTLSLEGNLNGVLNVYGGAKNITVEGSVVGSETGTGGSIFVHSGGIEMIEVKGSLFGNAGSIGNIMVVGDVTTLEIGGSVIGAANNAGRDYNGQLTIFGHVKVLTIDGDVIGRGRHFGGYIGVVSAGTIVVGGSLIGSDVTETGLISVLEDAGKIEIRGDVKGGDAWRGTGIFESAFFSGALDVGGNLGVLRIGGDVIAGPLVYRSATFLCGAVSVGGVLGTAKIEGSILGSQTHPASILVGGIGVPAAYAIKSFTVGGSVIHGSIVMGYSGLFTDRGDPSAGIDRLVIRDDFVASYIIAGADAGFNGRVGDGDDRTVNSVATINSVKIYGSFHGLSGSSMMYSIYAPHILHLTVGHVHYTEEELLAGVQFTEVGIAIAKADPV